MSASPKRLEEMLQNLLQSFGVKQNNVLENGTEPLSSTKVVETSGLTLMTTEAWKLIQNDFLLHILKHVATAVET